MAILTPALLIAGLAAAFTAAPAETPARAAVSTVICGGALPGQQGEVFSGPVLHVFDGRTFCVAYGPTPAEWIRVRLDLQPGASTRQSLMAAAFARRVVCEAGRRDGQGLVARCTVDDTPLDAVMQSADVRAAAPFWR